MRILFFGFLVLLTACQQKYLTSQVMQEAESVRVKLMTTESEVYGNFFTLRIFHSDLMQVTTAPEKFPYTTLDSLYKSMVDEANGAILPRLVYDTVYFQIVALDKGKKYIRRNDANASLFDRFYTYNTSLPPQQDLFAGKYRRTRESYASLANAQGIRRFSPPDFSKILDEKLFQWEDSLEMIGKMIANEKLDLKQRFGDDRSPAMFAAYKPISELEAQMKDFQSKLAQLQNSLSRFEDANPQDFFYYGPFIRPRMEAQASEDIIASLSLLMKDCRNKEREYWQR